MSPVGQPCINPVNTEERAANGTFIISKQQSNGNYIVILNSFKGCIIGKDETFSIKL